MTPADRFFDQPPEMTILGPLGSFRLFGTLGNDFATENKYYSWSDNLAWMHGNHRTRAGGFFLMQNNGRDDPGVARGRLVFQTFNDFLLGLSADGNLSPSGRSNIQSVQASEGVGPRGEVQYHYRSYYGAAFLQNDYKDQSATQPEPGYALGICRASARYSGRDRQRVARPAAPGGDSTGVRHAAGQHGGSQL